MKSGSSIMCLLLLRMPPWLLSSGQSTGTTRAPQRSLLALSGVDHPTPPSCTRDILSRCQLAFHSPATPVAKPQHLQQWNPPTPQAMVHSPTRIRLSGRVTKKPAYHSAYKMSRLPFVNIQLVRNAISVFFNFIFYWTQCFITFILGQCRKIHNNIFYISLCYQD